MISLHYSFRMKPKSESPWSVDNLEDFMFYCCPECNERNWDRDHFLEHAFDKHPLSQEYLQKFKVKEEIVEENNFVKEEGIEEFFEIENVEQEEIHLEKKENLLKSDTEEDKKLPIKKERKVSSTIKLHKCSWCDKAYDLQWKLKAHIKAKHFEIYEKLPNDNRCHECNKVYSSQDCLKKHQKLVHLGIKKEKTKQCDLCPQKFISYII